MLSVLCSNPVVLLENNIALTQNSTCHENFLVIEYAKPLIHYLNEDTFYKLFVLLSQWRIYRFDVQKMRHKLSLINVVDLCQSIADEVFCSH